MSRKRSTWSGNRTADPYTMHQKRDLPPVEKYLIGDPSAFGEDVHQDLPDDAALGRNEIGMPNMPASNMNHKDVDMWNSDQPYDNAGTFSPEDRDRKETPDVPVSQMNDRRISNIDKYAALERKSFHCARLAYAMLPNASDEVLEQQTFEFMTLPDQFVISAALRLAEEEEKKEDEKDEKHDDDEKDEKEDSKKEASVSDDDIAAMIHSMEMEEACGMEGDMEEDLDIIISDMVGDDMGLDASDTDFNINMSPTMDNVGTDVIAGDVNLQNLFANTIPEGARQPVAPTHNGGTKAASKKGITSLGGRVKGASSTEGDLMDLSKLWKTDPDVSGNF